MSSHTAFTLALCLLALSAAVNLVGVIYKKTHAEPAPVVKCHEPVHLPSKCAEFYNDDTDAWINCMGVGYVYRRDL